MVSSFVNRCIWAATSSGLGDFVVNAPSQNGFTPAQCASPAVVDGGYYHYFAVNGAENEEGDGQYTAGTTTLSRLTIRTSSNSGSKVNFSAPPTVFMGGPIASDIGIVVVTPVLGSIGGAASNATLIQAALNNAGTIVIRGNGLAYISGRLVISSYTHLIVDPTLTIIQAPTATATNVLVNTCVTASWTTGLTVTWVSGLTASVAWTSHGKSVGDFVWIDGTAGTTDSAYSGVFPILSVTDANNFVVGLRRLPAAVASGSIQGKLADQDITIEGGTWDQNYPNISFAADNTTAMGVILAGIHDLTIHNMYGTEAAKYAFYSAGLNNFEIDGVRVYQTNSDGYKIFGPSWDGIIKNCHMDTNDDAMSLHSDNGGGFTQYNLSNGLGDALNIQYKDNHIANTTACGIILYIGANNWMTEITIDGTSGKSADTLINVKGTQTGSAAGLIRIKNTMWEIDNGVLAIAALASPGTLLIDILEIDGFTSPRVLPSSYTSYPITVSACTIHQFTLKNLDFIFSTSTYSAIGIQSTATVETMHVQDSVFYSPSGVGNAVRIDSPNVYTLFFSGNEIWNTLRGIWVTGVGATINIHDNFIYTAQGTNVDGGSSDVSFFLSNNAFYGTYQGLVRSTTTGNLTVKSSGNINAGGGAVWMVQSGAATVNVYGWDFQVDVTTITATVSSYCYNTNASAGYGPAGLVVCGATGWSPLSPGIQFISLSSDQTGTNGNSAQTLFPGGGFTTLTVPASTTYDFEGQWLITRAAGNTSHTTSILFGGSATYTSIGYLLEVTQTTGSPLDTTASDQFWSAVATATEFGPANTSTTENLTLKIKGFMRINGAGTVIPQFIYSVAPGGAPTVAANSYIKFTPLGTNTVLSVGNWS